MVLKGGRWRLLLCPPLAGACHRPHFSGEHMTDISASADKKPIARVSVRRVLGWLHLWTGIIFCIPFVALGISGSILMIGHDMPAPVADLSPGSKPIVEIIAA